MKTFLLACVTVAGISVVAYYGLHTLGFSSTEVGSGPSVRLD
jgi:hypothetical protein